MNRKPGNIQPPPVFAALRLGKTSNIERRMIQLTMPDWMLNVECLLAIYRSWILNVFHSPIGGRP